MPRKPVRRLDIDIGDILSGIGNGWGGGEVEAIAPGDVPYTDASFDANTQTRFRPANPGYNVLSGGRGTEAANLLNTKQILLDQQARNQLALQPEIDKLEIAKQNAIDTNKVNLANKQIELNKLIGTREGALAMVNDSILRDNPNATMDMLYGNDDYDLVPKQYEVKSRVNAAQFGDKRKDLGYQGAQTADEHTQATTEYSKALTKEVGQAKPKQNIFHFQGDDGSKTIVDYDKGVVFDIVNEVGPNGLPTGRTKHIMKDLATGAVIKQVGDNPPAVPTIDKKPTTANGQPTKSSIGNRIKDVFSNTVNTLGDTESSNAIMGNTIDKVFGLPKRTEEPSNNTYSVRAGKSTGYPKAETMQGGNAGVTQEITDLVKQDIVNPSLQTKNRIKALMQSLPEGYLNLEQLYQLLGNQ